MKNKIRNIISQKFFPIILLSVASIISYIFYLSQAMTLFYNDSTSHLNISRRVVDNLHPSLAQIGSTWLPLLHILELPLIWITPFWQSGFAGSIISMISFVLLGLFLYKILFLLTKDKKIALLGPILAILNANLLYIQSAPMFEPLCLATSVGSIYFLLRWNIDQKISSVILSALFIMLSTLSRYDGWFYAIFQTIVLGLLTFKKNGMQKAESLIVLFSCLAFFGIFLWLLYNTLIFGSPLYFEHNEYSAFTQQLVYENRGDLPTKGNLILSILVYIFATFYNLGWILAPLLLIGVFVIFKNFKKLNISTLAILSLLVISPLLFNIYALFKGHTIVVIPELPPHGIFTPGIINGKVPFFNIRYGLMTLPGYIILIALTFWRTNIFIKLLSGLLILLQVILFYINPISKKPSYNFVLAQDIIGSRKHLPEKQETTKWFKAHYDGGLILASSASMDIELFENGIDLKNYITEGTRNYWTDSLKDPSKYARWILLQPDHSDKLGKSLMGSKGFKKFTLVYKSSTMEIYKKIKPSL